MTVGRSAGVTDTGRKRRRNEDTFVLAPPLFAVADGMGGAQAGEVASKLAAASLEGAAPGRLRGEQGVAALIREANRRVFERARQDPTASGMGTTLTLALVEDSRVVIGHVGDSRAYLVRSGALEQLTDDHSLVNELMKSGRLSPEEAETHPQRSVITRALGTDPEVDADTFAVGAQEGDVFLLCSDGLTSMVADDAILSVLERHRGDLRQATRALVEAANRGGGEDNITVVAFEIAPSSQDFEETMPLPAAASIDEDEDTLTGIEAVPTPAPPTPASEPEGALRRNDEAHPPGGGVVRSGVLPAAEAKTGVASPARLQVLGAIVLLLAVAAVLVVWGLLH